MCGILGISVKEGSGIFNENDILSIAKCLYKYSASRGKDASGLISCSKDSIDIQFCVTSQSHKFSLGACQWLGINPKVEVISLRSKSCVF